jgi:hypothetical protein
MDVKFLTFTGKRGEKIRRFQYTAIDVNGGRIPGQWGGVKAGH